MNKGFLYTLTGLPYSGKTTLTNELVKRFGFKIASMDDIMSDMGLDPVKMTQDDWNAVYSASYDNMIKMLQKGESVVLDCGNLPKSERTTAKNIAAKAGADFILIYLNVSKEDVRKRWLKNAETKERDQLEEITLNTALDMFEEPTQDENPILYNQSMDLEEWLKRNIVV